MQQQLEDNDVSQLKSKLSALGVNLEVIMEQQKDLLEIKNQVHALEKDIETMRGTVKAAELITDKVQVFNSQIKTIEKEIDDIWDGMDYLSNPLND